MSSRPETLDRFEGFHTLHAIRTPQIGRISPGGR